MTTIEAKITSPTGVSVTMEITMTLGAWLRLRDDLQASISGPTASRPKNDYTKRVIEAIDDFADQLEKPANLYTSRGMAVEAVAPPKPETDLDYEKGVVYAIGNT